MRSPMSGTLGDSKRFSTTPRIESCRVDITALIAGVYPLYLRAIVLRVI